MLNKDIKFYLILTKISENGATFILGNIGIMLCLIKVHWIC